MSLKINYKLTLGSQTYGADERSQLLSLQTSAALAIPINQCTITLTNPAGVKVELGDSVTVALGYGNDLTPVFKGQVSHLERGLTRLTLEASSALSVLTRTYLNRLYEKPKSGDIVKDVLTQTDLKSAQIDNGLNFSIYTLGDTQSAYGQLQHLAQQCGVDFYADVDDQIVFATHKATKTHGAEYGKTILKYDCFSYQSEIDRLEVYGESPASKGQGDKATTWFTQKEIKGSSGKSSGTTLRIADPTARTEALAQKIATSLLAVHQTKAQGRLMLLGNPEIQLGHAIKLSNLPQSQQNGTFKVVGVTQRLSDQLGFVTTVDWEAV